MNCDWLKTPAKALDENCREQALQHQAILTKPPGALGVLEEIAISLAAMQANSKPELEHIHITVFAADHGITSEGVSAFPQSVTVEMIRNFANGGAAINVLAQQLGAKLNIINMGTVTQPEPMQGVTDLSIDRGTANFLHQPAMSNEQLFDALNTGRQAAERAQLQQAQLFIAGDMGIGNTTSATALACAILGLPATKLTGPGTGLDSSGIEHKTEIIDRALNFHRNYFDQPLEISRRLGGFEIAGIIGSYIACAQMGLPVLVDGFIAGTAALMATRLHAGVADWLIFAHASAEPGHARIMQAMQAKPILDLGMRLGEGSGAAVAVPLLRLACALHNNMATFEQASVSEKNA
ncbi:MAG: nicotinate-nucleotide--dimethylbenzimidazole phosphoribosyltransferase [Gammaproteobacteria bacterium]|nr:nicotinate-nucleotide--dimethylbenzimidazole phosphoribosyltransferase [Gammaproteobacteria bacterium]